MEWNDLLGKMVKQVGVVGVQKAEEALERLASESKEPWKKAIMNLLADAVEQYGMRGIDKIEDAIEKIGDGETPDIKFASLKAQSDFLAMLQNMEADDKSKARDFIKTIGYILGNLLKAILAGAMS